MGSKRRRNPPSTPSSSSSPTIPPKDSPNPITSSSSDDDDSDDHHSAKPVSDSKDKTKRPWKVSQRPWTDEEEILVLKAMLDNKNKGWKPDSLGPLSEFVNASVRPGLDRTQLSTKLHALKSKYYRLLHQLQSDFFTLSKKVWDNDDDAAPQAYAYLDQSLAPPNLPELSAPPPGLLEFFSKGERNANMMASLKAKGFDKRWRDALIAQTKAYLERLDLVADQTQAMLDALD